MWNEQRRFKKKTYGDVNCISCRLNSDNLNILHICNQELVNYMFPQTTYCSM